ncbi:MAG: type I DNA topoisomerase [Candidatus Saccharibacteria bacterium]|nr:type I DNA topoisomerase [Candidatus Saccharibacteria bacterium]
MSKNLVIVESPAKAKTIEKYLGGDFKVLSSIGHIRKDTKVDVHDNFAVTYEIDPGHQKVVRELKSAAKAADIIWLATDEDREGESISWHLLEVLKLPKDTRRITFHEITAPALKHAIAHPRVVDMHMVSSQQARQTLDMLVGYDLSGVVRRKVPGAISAGRVQSPALRLIVEKEREIEKFADKSTFKITGSFTPHQEQTEAFIATLEKLPVTTEAQARELLEDLRPSHYTVTDIDQAEGSKSGPVPFATAALQIEANSRLGFSSSTTMRAAQALYQAGHITYHRTDSLNLSAGALSSIASYIEQNFGKNYLKVRHFKTKSASAQEAHEAIRPTHIEAEIAGSNDFERKLYHLIRTRTLATQMSDAKVAKTTITVTPTLKPNLNFIAKGEVLIFDGFLKVYGKTKELELPSLRLNSTVFAQKITARQTFAKPPARYTEGSLVKKLEELGIGRPSTYASIMSAIQNRGYVVKGDSEGTPREVIELTLVPSQSDLNHQLVSEKSGATKGKLLPTPVGELVSDFLLENFENIVDYGFTADIEQKLDLIAEQKLDRVKMLRDFYTPFAELVGASATANRYNSATELGIDPKTQKPIYAKIGKNGGFIQLGDNEKDSGEKPRFMPLPKGKTVKTITLEDALRQLALPTLPRKLGASADGTLLIAASGPFGPYLKAGSFNIPLKGHDPYTVDLGTATELYQAKKSSIIADWGEIQIINGAYGPYIKGPGRRNNLKIDKTLNPHSITESQARELLSTKTKPTSRHAPHRRTTKTTRSSKVVAKSTVSVAKSAQSGTKTTKSNSKSTKSDTKTTKAKNSKSSTKAKSSSISVSKSKN